MITPDPQKLKVGQVGVGTRVTLKDDKDKVLADLIIGKEFKDQPNIRHVRRPDRDQIYRVSLKTDKLSTKFEDWIEKDLLKLNAFDVREVGLNDYSSEEVAAPGGGIGLRMHQRSRMKLGFDDAKSSWSLIEMAQFDQKRNPVPVEMADDEELNNEKLNALKSALDDLQIVDVERKPKGLSQDLRASDEFVKDTEAQASLMTRGFYPVGADGQVEIYSSEGEATCTTKDGVKYILRFGQLAGGADNKDDKQPDGKEAKNPALNRFLFVMAQFDEGQIPKPQLEPEPGQEPPAAPKADDTKADEPAPDAPKAEEKKTNAAKVPTLKAAPPKPAAKKAEPNVPQKKTAAGQEEQPAAADAPKADVPQGETKGAESKDADKKGAQEKTTTPKSLNRQVPRKKSELRFKRKTSAGKATTTTRSKRVRTASRSLMIDLPIGTSSSPTTSTRRFISAAPTSCRRRRRKTKPKRSPKTPSC